MPNELPPLVNSEHVGRRIRDRKKAKSPIVPKVFRERSADYSISVDRMDHAPREEVAELGEAQASNLGRTFRGWAILTIEDVRSSGREIEATPQLDNRYHADIELNIPDGEEKNDEWEHHLGELSSRSSWEAWS